MADDESTNYVDYRQRAQELYSRRAQRGEKDTATHSSSENLIEELRIHQIELELQNEELQRAGNEAEQAREAAEAERDRYYQLFYWSPAAYLLIDGAGRITEANDSAAKLLGVERHELLSRTLNSFFDSGEAARAMAAVTRTAGDAAEGGTEPLTVTRSGPESGPTFLELHMRRSRDRNDTAETPILIAMSDVTDRKLREEEHERSLRYYRRLLREMSHRVKNNLQVLASIIELERRGHENDPVLKRMATRVRNVAHIHTALHEAATDVESVDLVASVQGFVDQFSSSLAPHLTLVFGPAPHKRITVEAQRAAQLTLVLNELLTNATQHAFPYDRTGTIRVSLAQGKGTLKLTVADDGVGMSGTQDGEGDRQPVGALLVTQFVDELGGEWRTESAGAHDNSVTPVRPHAGDPSNRRSDC